MRTLLLATTCLCLAACGKAPDRESDSFSATANSSETSGQHIKAYDVSQPSDQALAAPAVVAPGGIAVTAAPGVAFAYHYAFRLPSDHIAAAQEAHAQAGEKLGIARCRITGCATG